jgi:tetratricopeptide (TPR) repeat protein
MRCRLAALATALAAAAVPGTLRAQAADELLAQGVRSYQNLEYDAAAGLLRRSLALTGERPLTDTDRARAFMYLGATEIFRGRRDSALASFRRLVLLDPRFRSDQLVFPPEVSNTFDLVRRAVPAVTIVAAEAEVALGDALYPVRLYASAFHDIQAVVTTDEGQLVRQLYIGPIADSLVVRWDGLDSAGTRAAVGRFQLVVVSRNAQGRPLRRVQLALETAARVSDSLPHPKPPTGAQLLPERQPNGPAWRSLVGGLVAGGAAALLPVVITGESSGSGTRFVVAGSLGLTGVIGFFAQRPGRALPANVAANRALRDAWQRQVAATVEDNARRAADVRLRITPGRVTRVERETP